jgi:hypothetical protein
MNSIDNPIHGTGQGSCSSPAIWLFISSFLMDLLQENANGMHMHYVKMDRFDKLLSEWIEGFVDDTSIFTNLEFGNNNLIQLLQRAQADGQKWERLLHTTGGELELEKCFYYILSWKWTKHGNPIPQTIEEQNIPPLKLQLSSTNSSTILTQQEVYSSHKTLGV